MTSNRPSIKLPRMRLVTLQDAERAARIPLRDAHMVLDTLSLRLQQLRALDARSRALLQDASGLRPGDVLIALLDARRANA